MLSLEPGSLPELYQKTVNFPLQQSGGIILRISYGESSVFFASDIDIVSE